MPDDTLRIKRYPNRRFYARHVKKYVSLEDIERWIRQGHRVEIEDSQTGDDLTRTVLTQLLVERHPDKMALFPSDLLHFMLRANDLMSDFLRNYFRDSLTYLEYLQSPSTAPPVAQSMGWMRSWFDRAAPSFHAPETRGAPPAEKSPAEKSPEGDPPSDAAAPGPVPSDRERARRLAEQVAELEQRIRRLESHRGEESE